MEILNYIKNLFYLFCVLCEKLTFVNSIASSTGKRDGLAATMRVYVYSLKVDSCSVSDPNGQGLKFPRGSKICQNILSYSLFQS